MILTLVATLALWPVQNVIHEGCHALCALFFGATITRFVPWPVTVRGTRYFAYMRWAGGTWTDSRRALTAVAPQLGAFLIFVLCWLLAHHVWTTPLLITSFVDLSVNLATFYRKVPRSTDGWRFQRYTGVSVAVCRVVTVLVHLLGGGVLIHTAWTAVE